METLVKSVEEFSKITDTRINAEKSHLICINNRSKNKEDRTIKFLGGEIFAEYKFEQNTWSYQKTQFYSFYQLFNLNDGQLQLHGKNLNNSKNMTTTIPEFYRQTNLFWKWTK
ncbi:hypothetical protein Glove_9g179 [Diversispora epigaea]|uniref:Uncharacterized protein n=1 Tax=Diversispora epigaea TaxID=1348612 RepID=A0A397JQI9_9GLOM|nr:hypothetical protein Glove_9g179 [Diversispora epigaea]